jgi:adenylate kinase
MQLVSLYGKPLSGKGTQADFFVKQGFFHLPVGDYMREQAKAGDRDCQAVMSLIEAGDLVPDELVCGIVARIIDEKERQGFKGVLLDGFPRTLPQAHWLDELAEARAMPLTVVELHCEDNNVLNNRRLKRMADYIAAGKTPRAEDVDEKKFWHRLNVYAGSTAKVADHYEARGQLIRVQALQSPQAVWNEISQRLNLSSAKPGPQPGF